MGRINLIRKYCLNNRLDDYIKILAYANKKGYQIISLNKYVNRQFNQNEKVLILRHDIDHASKGAELMFEYEKAAGAYASYYFRFNTVDEELIKKINEYGSEVSLHFETIADFAKNQGIKSKEELYKTDFKKVCLLKLKQDLAFFRDKYNVLCETIASHGELINREINTPNNILTEDDTIYDFLGIKMEAYNKNLIDNFNIYICDTVMEINNGYSYGNDPFSAINNNCKVILFLTHPNHWHYSLGYRMKKMLKCLIKAPIIQDEKFKRI